MSLEKVECVALSSRQCLHGCHACTFGWNGDTVTARSAPTCRRHCADLVLALHSRMYCLRRCMRRFGRVCCRRGGGGGGGVRQLKQAFQYVKTVVGGVTTVADIVTDVVVCKTFWDTRQTAWFWLSVAILALVPVINTYYSLRMGLGLEKRKPIKSLIRVFAAFIGNAVSRIALTIGRRWRMGRDGGTGTHESVQLHLELLSALFKSIFKNGRQSDQRIVDAHKKTEMVFEAIPQGLLQTYVIVLQFATIDPTTQQRIVPTVQQAVSLLLSVATISIGITVDRWKVDYSGAIVEVQKGRAPVKSGIIFMLASVLWTFCEICVRTASVAIFAVAYKGFVLIALALEFAVRVMLQAVLHKCGCRAFFSCGTSWIVAIRQLLVMESGLSQHDPDRPAWDRVIFATLTVTIQTAFILLPTLNERFPQLAPPRISIVPPPIASGVCWDPSYPQNIPQIFLDVVEPDCVNRFPAMFIVVALLCSIISFVSYLIWQACDTRYKTTARRLKRKHAEEQARIKAGEAAGVNTGAPKDPAPQDKDGSHEDASTVVVATETRPNQGVFMGHLVVTDNDNAPEPPSSTSTAAPNPLVQTSPADRGAALAVHVPATPSSGSLPMVSPAAGYAMAMQGAGPTPRSMGPAYMGMPPTPAYVNQYNMLRPLSLRQPPMPGQLAPVASPVAAPTSATPPARVVTPNATPAIAGGVAATSPRVLTPNSTPVVAGPAPAPVVLHVPSGSVTSVVLLPVATAEAPAVFENRFSNISIV